MGVSLTINGRQIAAATGLSIFDAATRTGVRVPTSCVTQGKCKECVVEVSEGMGLLTPPTSYERHLNDRFRLSCQARLAAASGEGPCPTTGPGPKRKRRPPARRAG